jgi:predicted kinase
MTPSELLVAVRALDERHDGPSVFIICGNAGVGKTTLGLRLAQHLSACLLDIDTVSERLVKVGLLAIGMDPNDRDSPAYKRHYRSAIHETLFDLARQNLPHIKCVIVAPFTQERRSAGFLRACEELLGATTQLIYVTCDDVVRKARIESRGNPRDASKLTNWHTYSQLGRDDGPPPFPHLLVDTSGSA